MTQTVGLRMPSKRSAVIEKIAAVFARHIHDRCGAEVTTSGQSETTVWLDVNPGIGTEGFRIEDGPDGSIRIIGNDERGLLYGVGKFLRTSQYARGQFIPGDWRGTSVPEKPVRGIYFATHFHNYYHDAPLTEVERYIEDLALWGFNAVCVWFDMHHFTGINDPAAEAMIERLRAILLAANKVGLDASLTSLANEAYGNSPEELRADWTGGHDGYRGDLWGHYNVELCPNKPGAKGLMLRWVEEKLEAFSDIDIKYYWLGPYDQGGCTCSQCKPWGINGFLTMSEPTARLYRRYFPGGKVVLHTWHFDVHTDGEWEGLGKAFSKRPEWVDYIMADAHEDEFPQYPLTRGVPGGLPMLNFPEISMYACNLWGGFGGNPFPQRLQRLWETVKGHVSGGFPYSEGIFEDIDKAICAQFYWQPDKPAVETVREYITYEYSPDVVGAVSGAIEIMEQTLPRHLGKPTESTPRLSIDNTNGVNEAYRLMEKANRQLPPGARSSWRWRILYLRALIDFEVVNNGLVFTDRCEEAFRELVEIYHAHEAAYVVSPPTRESIRAARPQD